jgi:geranylgeranyl pyrophosphate synthase
MDHLKKEFDFFLELFLEDYSQYKEVFLGGKRLRPIIVFEIASYIDPLWRTDNNTSFIIKNYAIILEMIHCTSLIIDDLPSMDNDTYRRGELTFHTKHGRHGAYLMVYNLLATIKNILWENDNESLLYLELEIIINEEMMNLVLGQQYDLDVNWLPDEGSRTLKIAELKTGSLFKLATLGPLFLLRKNEKIEFNILKNKLLEIGVNLGISFQLSDDHLDLDIDSNTNNYGLETSPSMLRDKYIEYTKKIIKAMSDLNFKKESIIYDILELMDKRFSKKIL